MKEPNLDKVVKEKKEYYGEVEAAYYFAAEQYGNDLLEYNKLFGESGNLLEKYIQHVEYCEGSNFISSLNRHSDNVHFSDKEVDILKSLSE